APGQLVSVSYLAQDPSGSAMAEEAQAYPTNRGLAEEIFLLEPDLVIAGTFTTRATVGLLRRLGVPVAEFEPANALSDIRDRLVQMGALLGREAQAARVLAAFDADLAEARVTDGPRPRAATYYANSYTSGAGTLANSVIDAAGLDNLGAALGIEGGGRLALETLVTEAPDLVITGRQFETPALAQEVLAHPALAALQDKAGTAPVADRDWVCGTPKVLAAIRRLAAARDAVLDRR
ncbi:MAG: ABC transporter substrate-binding protein, partial [Pseudomonadota bacterium]